MPLSDKDSRHALIRQIIRESGVFTQSQLVDLLLARGKKVTQATVSRDLQELGVYTERNQEGRSIYMLAEDRLPVQKIFKDQLQKVLEEWTQTVSATGNLVVLKTPPGSAQVIAAALDRASHPDILATLAGDDTVLIVTADNSMPSKNAVKLANEIAGMAGLQAANI